jgi:hypothetical protein
MNEQQLLGLAIILFVTDFAALLAWPHLMRRRDAQETQRKLSMRHNPAQRSELRKKLPSGRRPATGTHKPHPRGFLKHSPREKRGHRRRHEGS